MGRGAVLTRRLRAEIARVDVSRARFDLSANWSVGGSPIARGSQAARRMTVCRQWLRTGSR